MDIKDFSFLMWESDLQNTKEKEGGLKYPVVSYLVFSIRLKCQIDLVY